MTVVMVVRGGGWRNDAGIWGCLIYCRMSRGTPGLFLQMLGAPTAVTPKMFPDTPDAPQGAELHRRHTNPPVGFKPCTCALSGSCFEAAKLPSVLH